MLTTNFAANRGVAFAGGRIFVASFDGRLIALDATTGKELWSVQTVPPQSMQFVTGAPRAFAGKVIIGQAGADFGERGYVTAYDQETGKQLWRFYVTPGSPQENKGDPVQEMAAKTWNGEWWKTGTGGGPWGPITYDRQLGRIYIGTANAAPIDPETRGLEEGDNLFTAAVVALDAGTGEYIWHYQVNPRDSWDYDATAQMTLAELLIDGEQRKVLMTAPKNGFLYVIDRESGKVISAGKIVKVTWADHIDIETGRPVEAADIRFEKGDVVIWPNPTGAHNWHSQSFSPKTGLLYIPAMHNGVRYSKTEDVPGGFEVGGLSIGSEIRDERDGKGSLLAWDPVAQKEVWRVMRENIWNGGVLSTAGGLVFQGDAYGKFHAHDAETGKQLWSYNAGLGTIAAPMSYEIAGKQYIAILVGWGGSASVGSDVMNVGWKYGANTRRLLVFALGGKAKLTREPGPTLALQPVDDPAIRIDPAKAEAGETLFLACALCHGRDVISAGSPGPDLRESPLAMDPAAFRQIVRQGTLIERGMPRYDALRDRQVDQLYHYVRQEARRAKDQARE
jgi:quinohemoprotein ethanol dehydrogenase